MTTKRGDYVRINRTPFSRRWEVVRLASDGKTIVRRWELHPRRRSNTRRAFAHRVK